MMHVAMDRDLSIKMIRAKHSSESGRQAAKLWVDTKLQRSAEDGTVRTRIDKAELSEGGFPVTGPWTFREPCAHDDHDWVDLENDDVDDASVYWRQCRTCLWCVPIITEYLQLPPMLEGFTLPRLNDVGTYYALAGFILSRQTRVRVVQYVSPTAGHMRRCGIEVRSKSGGWWEAGVFWEDQLYKVLPVVAAASLDKPKALWLALQAALKHNWGKPW